MSNDVMRCARGLFFLCLVSPGLMNAQQPAAADRRPPACSSYEYRQFDFWVGDWKVYEVDDETLAGTNHVTLILDGCVLHENWAGVGGAVGQSFSMYDARRDVWHQTWVDGSGLLLQLDGRLEGGSMVLRGELLGRDGAIRQHRITWSPQEDGSVRQHWETSADGESWDTVFDGSYRKMDGG
jgi:hypothetical protein